MNLPKYATGSGAIGLVVGVGLMFSSESIELPETPILMGEHQKISQELGTRKCKSLEELGTWSKEDSLYSQDLIKRRNELELDPAYLEEKEKYGQEISKFNGGVEHRFFWGMGTYIPSGLLLVFGAGFWARQNVKV